MDDLLGVAMLVGRRAGIAAQMVRFSGPLGKVINAKHLEENEDQ